MHHHLSTSIRQNVEGLEASLGRGLDIGSGRLVPRDGRAASIPGGRPVHQCICLSWTHHRCQTGDRSAAIHQIRNERIILPDHLRFGAFRCSDIGNHHPRARRAQYICGLHPLCRNITEEPDLRPRRRVSCGRFRRRPGRPTCAPILPHRRYTRPRPRARHRTMSCRRAKVPAPRRRTRCGAGDLRMTPAVLPITPAALHLSLRSARDHS